MLPLAMRFVNSNFILLQLFLRQKIIGKKSAKKYDFAVEFFGNMCYNIIYLIIWVIISRHLEVAWLKQYTKPTGPARVR